MNKQEMFFDVANEFEIPIDTAFTIRQCYEDEFGEFTLQQLKDLSFHTAIKGMKILNSKNEDETEDECIERLTELMDSSLLIAWCNEQIEILKEMEGS